MKMKAPTKTTKLKSALLNKAVECNPVMARCLKCKKETGAAFSPYHEIQGQWQKTNKTNYHYKVFFSPHVLNQCQTTPIITFRMTFLNTPLLFTPHFLLL
jgi:hypothetical protein